MSSSAEVATPGAVSADDRAFIGRFERCELPEEEWTHLAHVRVAWIALMSDSASRAIDRVRTGILRYNTEVLKRRHKYHETVTIAFARIIHDRLRRDETWPDFRRRIDDILSANEPILMKYYSAERLMSDEARRNFAEPDLGPLPGGV